MRLEHVSKLGVGAEMIPGSVDLTDAGAGSQSYPGVAELAATIIDQAPDGIVIVDLDGVISFANRAAAEMFGYPRGALAGLAVEALVDGCMPHFQTQLRQASGAAGGAGRMIRLRDVAGRRADGSDVAVEMSLSPAVLGGHRAAIAVMRPVDDDRASESELFRRLLVQEDERIATELNDRVVKRLFLAGMKIQSVLQLTDHPVTQRLSETVDQLDTVIREIRHTVFAGSLPPTGDAADPLQA